MARAIECVIYGWFIHLDIELLRLNRGEELLAEGSRIQHSFLKVDETPVQNRVQCRLVASADDQVDYGEDCD